MRNSENRFTEIRKPEIRKHNNREGDNMLSTKQVSKILGVHEKTIYLWIKQGKIIATRLGKNYKVQESEVEYIKVNGLRKTQELVKP